VREAIEGTAIPVVVVRWLAVVALLAATVSEASAEGAAIAEMEARVFARVNAHRVSIVLPAVAPSRELADSAREHSRAMASGERGFGHEGFQSRGKQLFAVIPYSGFGENISRHLRPAAEVPDLALKKWLGSEVHRKHVEGEYDLSGVGAALSKDGTWYLTQLFVLR
jgi:uncharacterized protein YkwD